MIEVFKTNVEQDLEAKEIVSLLLEHFPESRINFDLEDCDKILRIEGGNFLADKVMMMVGERGFVCDILE